MKYSLFFAFALFIGILACDKDKDDDLQPRIYASGHDISDPDTKGTPLDKSNPDYYEGEFRKSVATVKAKNHYKAARSMSATSELTPDELVISTQAGIPFSEDKLATLILPTSLDIVFHFDLSGSMAQEIGAVKDNAIEIFNTLAGATDEIRVGVSSGIEDFHLDLQLFNSATDFDMAVNSLVLGIAADEDYGEHFEQLSVLPNWSDQAAKIAVVFLDECPQGFSQTVDNGIQALEDAGIHLIIIYSGADSYGSDCQDPMGEWGAIATADDHVSLFRINQDGSIPAMTAIDQYILNIVASAFCNVGLVELKAIDPAYDAWIASVVPANYMNIDVCNPGEPLPFEITFNVPHCTPAGDYSFDVGLFGDNIPYARQNVRVTVEPTAVALDVHPTSCPNPINSKSKGLTPVAILGGADFDVSQIVVSSIIINGAAPVSSNIEDVATPYLPMLEKPRDEEACNTDGPDGFDDLILKFRTSDLVPPDPIIGDIHVLQLTATLVDGTCVVGEDIIKISN